LQKSYNPTTSFLAIFNLCQVDYGISSIPQSSQVFVLALNFHSLSMLPQSPKEIVGNLKEVLQDLVSIQD